MAVKYTKSTLYENTCSSEKCKMPDKKIAIGSPCFYDKEEKKNFHAECFAALYPREAGQIIAEYNRQKIEPKPTQQKTLTEEELRRNAEAELVMAIGIFNNHKGELAGLPVGSVELIATILRVIHGEKTTNSINKGRGAA